MKDTFEELKRELCGTYADKIHNFVIINTTEWYYGDSVSITIPDVESPEYQCFEEKIRNFENTLNFNDCSYITIPISSSRNIPKNHKPVCYFIIANVDIVFLTSLLKKEEYKINSFLFIETNVSSNKRPYFHTFERLFEWKDTPWYITSYGVWDYKECKSLLEEKLRPSLRIGIDILCRKLDYLGVLLKEKYQNSVENFNYRVPLKKRLKDIK